MDMTYSSGEVSEHVGDAVKPSPQIVGKNFEGRLIIQQIGQSLQLS